MLEPSIVEVGAIKGIILKDLEVSENEIWVLEVVTADMDFVYKCRDNNAGELLLSINGGGDYWPSVTTMGLIGSYRIKRMEQLTFVFTPHSKGEKKASAMTFIENYIPPENKAVFNIDDINLN